MILPKIERIKQRSKIVVSQVFFHSENSMLLNKGAEYNIPQKIIEKYDTERCFRVNFTREGLNRLQKKYRNIRRLPGFLNDLMKGKSGPHRNLILENNQIFHWAEDCSFVTIPNSSSDFKLFKEHRN
jgi:hypothetical protein